MAILTPDQILRLQNLPRPPALDVRLVDPQTGRASAQFIDYLQRLDDWHRRVLAILGE